MVRYKTINRYFYIYLREASEKFNNEEVYKLGCTTNLYNRNIQYKTSEVNVKKFITIIRFTPLNINSIIKECKDIELKYKNQYSYCNIIDNTGGTEFYYNDIKDSIVSFTKRNKDFKEYNPVIMTDEINEKEINQEIFNNRINPDSEENREFNKMFNSKINYINKFKKIKYFDGNVESKIKEIYEHINKDQITPELFIKSYIETNDKYSIFDIFTSYLQETEDYNVSLKSFKETFNSIIKIKNINGGNKENEINSDINEISDKEENNEKNQEKFNNISHNVKQKHNKNIINNSLNKQSLSKKETIKIIKQKKNKQIIKKEPETAYNLDIIKDTYLDGFQLETIDKMINFYKKHTKGYLNVCCRMGKTRLSLCFMKYMKFNNAVVFVPAITLLEQWKTNINKILPDYNVIIFDTKDKDINKTQDKTVYVCYYGNSKYFINNFTYDFKIFDEFHHLTSINLERTKDRDLVRNLYIHCLKVKSKYQLSLTATLKIVENHSIKKVLSNDDKTVFGEMIDKRTFRDGIKTEYDKNGNEIHRLCDFNVYAYEKRDNLNYLEQTINKEYKDKNKKQELIEELKKYTLTYKNKDIKQLNVNELIECKINKSLREIRIYNGIDIVLKIMFEENIIKKNIFFVNSINTINKICIPYINKCIEQNNYNIDVYMYHSKIECKDSKKILEDFEKSDKAILFAIYGLSEGYDMPYLDSVCIGERMTTNIRIAQSILRPTTYDKNNPNKKAAIILPCVFDVNDTIKNIEKNVEYNKVMSVLYQLKILNTNIEQKLIVKNTTKYSRINNIKKIQDYENNNIIFSSNFLKQQFFKLINNRLYTYKQAISKLKLLKKEQNISFNTIEEYKNNIGLYSYRFPINPEEFYVNDDFNWAEYLSIPLLNKDKIIELKNDYYKKYHTKINNNNWRLKINKLYELITDKKYDLITDDKEIIKDMFKLKFKTN